MLGYSINTSLERGRVLGHSIYASLVLCGLFCIIVVFHTPYPLSFSLFPSHFHSLSFLLSLSFCLPITRHQYAYSSLNIALLFVLVRRTRF